MFYNSIYNVAFRMSDACGFGQDKFLCRECFFKLVIAKEKRNEWRVPKQLTQYAFYCVNIDVVKASQRGETVNEATFAAWLAQGTAASAAPKSSSSKEAVPPKAVYVKSCSSKEALEPKAVAPKAVAPKAVAPKAGSSKVPNSGLSKEIQQENALEGEGENVLEDDPFATYGEEDDSEDGEEDHVIVKASHPPTPLLDTNTPGTVFSPSNAVGSTPESSFPVVLKDGFLVVPRSRDFSVNELEMLSKLKTDDLHKQLWTLLCCKARDSCDVLRPGVQEETTDRCLLYFTAAENLLRNYSTTETGDFVLSKITGGLRDSRGKAMWPASFYTEDEREGTFWYDKKNKALTELQKWYDQGQCTLNKEDRKPSNKELRVHHSTIRVGQLILNTCLAVSKETNNHVNKHWPKTFASGETISGHLQVIRKWYWNNVEAPSRATNNFRQKKMVDGKLWTKEMEVQKYRDNFKYTWYPGKVISS